MSPSGGGIGSGWDGAASTINISYSPIIMAASNSGTDFNGPAICASKITTDGLNIYTVVTAGGLDHELVIVSKDKELALETLKLVHTVISNAKAFIAGTFHGLHRDHLQRYLDEFCYRFNRRRGNSSYYRLLTACAAGTPATYSELAG